ncbi:hypothetical protein [Allokutzneria sp. NRRL B-24872]|uniref:hypothetical protein n=1 Tax=Allokutzneria sp. NRRL B-24872 TaxID=1137961 RepID=UPI0011780FF5|nr:hypothetical protein [Allokutzneria sp. NRRL B-24872]
MNSYAEVADALTAARGALPDSAADRAREAARSVVVLLAEAGSRAHAALVAAVDDRLSSVLDVCAELRCGLEGDLAEVEELRNPQWRATALERKWIAERDKPPIPVFGRRVGPQVKEPFAARTLWVNKHRETADGHYCTNKEKQALHLASSEMKHKSRFLPELDVNRITLDAAQRADEAGLWNGVKAVVEFDSVVGVSGKTGRPTTVVNVYRREAKTIHACPGSPK